MDTRTLLYSRLDALARKASNPLNPNVKDEATRLCKSLLLHTLDPEIVNDICLYWDSFAMDNSDLSKLADIFAVLIEPETEPDTALPLAVYQNLSEIINEHGETMDLEQLTAIMNAILAKGGL